MKRRGCRTSRGHVAGAAIPITRRDFLNGVPIAIGSVVAGGLFPEFVAAALAADAPRSVA